MKNNKLIDKLDNFLLNYWNGKEKLWKAFWIMGFLFQFIFIFILILLNYLGLYIGLTWSIKIIIFLISNLYTIWIFVSIWNCAYNVKNKIWGDLARTIIILNIILIFLIYTGKLSLNYEMNL